MGTKELKKEVFDKVQLELNQFGLLIYNANIKQLVDVKGHEYFSYLGQKLQNEAANQAKIDVAEAKMKGAAQEAKWELFKKQRAADSVLYEQEKQAEESLYFKTREAEALKNQVETSLFAMKQKAEGEQYAKFKEAEEDLYAKIKKAEGLHVFAGAQGFYVKTLMNSSEETIRQ
ncbi:hypothetical protein GIB67_021357 [Kingdonia uniflora]|uniref:Flotillin-like n=1 Tax=Kingdonia uniflora TaxID=39325 RepID=A0A7J7MCV5_9MAGN|nr:hypothetical protein GIB67_021357 [Kingdonia uniflora]